MSTFHHHLEIRVLMTGKANHGQSFPNSKCVEGSRSQMVTRGKSKKRYYKIINSLDILK